jgi:predicted transposase YbfD/YdcC
MITKENVREALFMLDDARNELEDAKNRVAYHRRRVADLKDNAENLIRQCPEMEEALTVSFRKAWEITRE